MSLEKKRQRAVCQILSFLFLFVLSLQSVPALANPVPPPPNPSSIDERNVDLTSGGLVVESVDLAIGPSDYHGLHFARQYVGDGWRIADVPTVSGSTSNPIVSFEGRSIPFRTVSGAYVPVFADGSTLNSTRTTFTSSDGTIVQFGVAGYQYPMFEQTGTGGLGTQVTYPDGTTWTFSYNQASFTAVVPGCYVDQFGTPCRETYYVARLSSITSSTGYQIKLTYASNTVSDTPSFSTWSSITRATALNNAIEYCNPTALSCSFSNTWPQATFTVNSTVGLYTQFTGKTDPAGRQTTYTYTSGRLSGIRIPGATADTLSYSYDTSNHVHTASTGGGTWTYAYPSGTQTTVTDPSSNVRTINYNSSALVTSMTAGGKTTSFAYYGASDPNGPEGLLKQVTQPEGNYTTYIYDPRGNRKITTAYPKPSVGGTPITTSVAYPSSCTSPYTLKNCNKPVSTTDGNGNVTNYTFDPNHGGLTQVQQPAPSTGGARPTTNIGYSATYARYLTGASTWSNSPAIYVPTNSTTCATAATCSGTANERVTSAAFPSSAVANNALPSSVTVRSGDSGIVETTALTYDNYGDVTSVDGPLSGTADTTVAFYNLARQQTGVISPDPDGSGSLTNPAQRITYDTGGRPYLVERGSAAGQTASALAGMTVASSQVTGYDAYGRAVTVTSKGSDGVAYALAQTSYDTAGQVSCVATRMNPTAYGSLPASACTLGTQGSYGPDRITSYHYDALGRADSVTTGYGTTDATTEQALTFTDNGQVATVKDALNNCTKYEYDGFDRLVKTHFPSTTVGAACSLTSDYEQYGFDANGNITSFRTRRGDTLTLTYDNLNRLTYKAIPYRSDITADQRRPVEYSYDLQGNLLSAGFDGTSGGQAVLFTYDALGRKLTETQVMDGATRTITSAYDAANSLTRLTYPDGNYIQYYRYSSGPFYVAYLNSSPLFYPRLNAASELSGLWRWNTGAAAWSQATGFGYDNLHRLSTLSLDLAGSSYDATTTLSYNPASQIISQARTNDAFAWPKASNVSRGYTSNGLNQYTADSSATYGYDANGNLAGATHVFDGTGYYDDYTYTYDIENRLVTAVWLDRSASGSTTITSTLRYDPLGRLYDTSDTSSGTTRFLYDGDDLVSEYNSAGTLLRRYVHGPGSGDDPQVWFEGSGVTDAARRYLYADERGSIVAVTDSSGNKLAINSYDEYGIPDSTDIASKGRFRYTGQAFIPEIGMYYYKARMYSPTLGRFMQTDPIGYGDGMNMYRYTHNDPVNAVDPSGLTNFPCVRGNDTSNCPPGPPPIDVFGYPCSVNSCVDLGWLQQAANDAAVTNQAPSNMVTGGVAGPQSDNEIVVTAKRIQEQHPVLTGIAIHWICGLCGLVYDGYELYQWWNTPEPCCFTAGTLVDTPSEQKAIETLKVGDLVISRDPKTGKTAVKPIVGITPAHKRRIWKLTISYKGDGGKWRDEQYETTDDHPWRTAQNQWVVTASLKKGQLLAREHGTAVVAEVVNTGATKLTYNLEIADFHTYFVGKAETWVHNSCPLGLRDATLGELRGLALRHGYKSVELFKTQELQLNSRDQIALDRLGNLYSYPRKGGPAQPLGINIDD